MSLELPAVGKEEEKEVYGQIKFICNGMWRKEDSPSKVLPNVSLETSDPLHFIFLHSSVSELDQFIRPSFK